MVAIGLLLAFMFSWPAQVVTSGKTTVFVTASFLDKNRLFVENLTRDEIRVFEDGRPRQVEFFASNEVPAVYGLLFDRGILPQPFEDLGLIQKDVTTATAAMNVAYQLVDLVLGTQAGWVATYDKEMRVALDFTQDGGPGQGGNPATARAAFLRELIALRLTVCGGQQVGRAE